MNAKPTAFLEIEHKFVVDEGFEREALFAACRALEPEREKALTVTDTYYVPPGQANRIYRHRIDKEIQQLTLKSRGGDNEVRTEINLDLGAARSQADAVEAWMGVIGALPGYGIVKEIRVFDFPDCEVVYYEATHDALRVCCVEFRPNTRGAKRMDWPHCSATNVDLDLTPTTARRRICLTYW